MSSFYEKLPEQLKGFTDPSVSRDKRLMAARGLLPIPPRELALVLFALALEEDEEISQEAAKSIESIPENVMAWVLSDRNSPPELLHYIARTSRNEVYYQKIILNPGTSDLTITYLARELESPSLLDLIASNQLRLIRSEPLFEALSTNPSISRSTLDRIVSFLNIHFAKERDAEGKYEFPFVDGEEGEEMPSERAESLTGEESVVGDEDFEESFLSRIEFSSALTEEHGEEWEGEQERRESLYSLIKKMKVVEKLKLALVGNKEARTYLAREPIKVIVAAVLKNPRITDKEIVSLAQSTSVDQDILRQISRQRKWMKNYAVKQALTSNPKTPTNISLGLLRHLMERDLRYLSRSKNVPSIVASSARRIVQEKKSK